jgi:hypothetical protein
MMMVGITGHQVIPDEALVFVKDSITRTISRFGSDLTGLSSLAAGADQLFAEAVLLNGGRLHIIIPCDEYDKTFKDDESLARFQYLLARAELVEELEHRHPSEEAFFDAGRRIVELSHVLVAVWDGREVRGRGGTSDIVNYAREKQVEVIVIWPSGVSR